MSTSELVEHFFRHEYGRLVAVLSRRVGAQHIDEIEDAVQAALLSALESWNIGGLPASPSAWLFRVAYHRLLEELRRRARRQRLLEQNGSNKLAAAEPPPWLDSADEVQDDLLRMLVVCCDEAIVVESQLILALKTLCGFSIREIALRLFTSEANVYKRLERARRRLRALPARTEVTLEQYVSRLPAVHQILYLLFTEGYLSSHAESAIRQELCLEAIRLTTLVAEHPAGGTPESQALLALMHLHAARSPARRDDTGRLLLLEEQDRSLWDQREIMTGLSWLSKSARGDVFSRYHAEAAIAAEHCMAPSFAETRWRKVVEYYALLEKSTSSVMHTLNRAVAMAEWQGPAAGLAVLTNVEPPPWLKHSYLWTAVLADLHRRDGDAESGLRYRALAYDAAPTSAIRAFLQRRLNR